MNSMQCKIYKSEKKDSYYIYIEASSSLDCLPEELTGMLGTLVHVMDLALNEASPLVQADAREVINKINEVGFYLQLPKKDPG